MTTAFLLAILASPAPHPAEPVALAYATSGDPTLRLPGDASSRRIQDVARLVDGASLELPATASLRIAFLDGRRFALHGPARAQVARDGLRLLSGSSQPLEPVPPLPHLPAIRIDDVGDRIGAIRLRSDVIEDLTPSKGATVLPDEVVLRFSTVRGATGYAIQVRDASGRSILARTASSNLLAVPGGTLEPGQSYTWTVEAADVTGTRLGGMADFATLGREEAAARALVRDAAGTLDPELLLALDRELGFAPSAPGGHVADGH
jgi:hypothetical protein